MNNNDIVFEIIKKSKKHLTAYEILDKFQKFKKIQPMAIYRSLKKLWQEAFEEQMNVMKEKFASMSGDTMSGLTGLLEDEQEETKQEESEPAEPISGDQTV